MLKKIGLSVIVIVAFIAYAYTQKGQTSQSIGVVKAPSIPDTQAEPPVAYKDGKYTGKSIDAYYGNVQVEVTIDAGKISEVVFLDYPYTRQTSETINGQAMPYLIQEAIQSQVAEVDIISGATQTSKAFIESMKSALSQAS